MRQPRAVVLVAVADFLAMAGAAGCSPEVKIDIGKLVVAHKASADLWGWSVDDATLFWTGLNEAGLYALQAVDVQTSTVHSVTAGHTNFGSPQLAASDSLLFFLADSTDQHSGEGLYQAPLADRRAGTAVPIATNVWQYSVSFDGACIALVDASTREMSTIELATGTRQLFGQASSGSFSPDGTRLLYAKNQGSGATVYLADPLNGAGQPFDFPGTIISWDGGTPKRVLQSQPYRVVDLVTGLTQALPDDIPQFEAFSGEPTDLTEGYYRWTECLDEQVADDGVTDCVTSQGLLYRVNLNTGQRDVVAKYNGAGWTYFAVSQDGQQLAVSTSPDSDSDLSLYVKTLAPP